MGEPSDDPDLDRTKSWANAHASVDLAPGPVPHASKDPDPNIRPGLYPPDGGSASTRSAASASPSASQNIGPQHNRSHDDSTTLSARHGNADDVSPTLSPPEEPLPDTKAEGATVATVEGEEVEEQDTAKKPNPVKRVYKSCIRGVTHFKNALFHSKINVLLVFVPVGIAAKVAHLNAEIVFAMNAIAVIPLAGMLSFATENVASRLGDTIGALINVTFGNAVELIIFIIALVKNEIRIVQASLIGSILSNLLLILGMAFTLGGLRYQEQIYNSTITQMSACLLSLSVMSLLLPTAFHAAFRDSDQADDKTLQVSRGTSIVLLFVYGLYLLFQLKSHAYLYQSMPQAMIDEESHPGVLANIMDSSSSSSSDSDSSSSSSDTSLGSHTTAKRIKRAFRNRRRRKSSASSKDASIVSSPSYDGSHAQAANSLHSSNENAPRESKRRRGSVLQAILSGDEGDNEGGPAPRSKGRSNADNDFAVDVSDHLDKRARRKERHRRSKQRRKNREIASANGENAPPAIQDATNDDLASVHVDFALPRPDVNAAEPGAKKVRPSLLPSRTSFKPPLPSLLSNNVFVTQTATQAPVVPSQNTPRTSEDQNLRRARSLPGRLNERSNQNANGPRPPIPPYTRNRTDPVSENEDKDDDEEAPLMSRTASVGLLLLSTGLVAICAEFLVDAIPEMVETSNISQAFVGLIILPVVGNAAEHVTAVTVAAKNKMDLAIGVAVGSSIQIALFVTPLVVILGWAMDKPMTLYFNIFETISLFVTAFVVNFLVLDGRSNYLEGALLMASYVIIALAAFFYPDADAQSQLGGSENR